MKFSTILALIATTVLGGLIGAGVGFLYAPRSGRATRAILLSKGVEIQEKVVEDLNLASNKVRGRVDNLTTGVKDRVVGLGGQLKDSVSSISIPFRAKAN